MPVGHVVHGSFLCTCRSCRRPRTAGSTASVSLHVSLQWVCYFCGLNVLSKSVRVLFSGIEAVVVLTLRYHIPSIMYCIIFHVLYTI